MVEMQKLLLILQLLPLLLLLYLSDKDVLGALIQVMWCSGEMVKLSSLGHLHPIYYINSGLLLQRKHLIFHFLLKELDLWSSPTGAFSFNMAQYAILKNVGLCHLLCHSYNYWYDNYVAVYAEKINCRATSGISGLHLYAMKKSSPLDQTRFPRVIRNIPGTSQDLINAPQKKTVLGTKFRKSELSKSNHHGDWFIYV